MGKNKERLYSKLTKWGERKIKGHYVNGYDPNTKYVYQFYECFSHGCVKCFDSSEYNEVLNKKIRSSFSKNAAYYF